METIKPEVQEQIVRILGELEIYFISANRFDWLTMCGIIASLFVGGAAIWFSWRTSKRQEEFLKQQNDIALFEKRYEVYRVVSLILGSTQQYKSSVEKVEKLIITLIGKLDKKKVADVNPLQIFTYATYFERIELLYSSEITKYFSGIEEFVNKYIVMLYKGAQDMLLQADLISEPEVKKMMPLLQKLCEQMSEEIRLDV